ncbi:hypothetical protein JXD38_01710 [candidate division WOR-3 bacterium]|nr:hypothetical protein [candidate division WOR-3 bacterium]
MRNSEGYSESGVDRCREESRSDCPENRRAGNPESNGTGSLLNYSESSPADYLAVWSDNS